MKSLQPNFEKVKTAFYQSFIKSSDANNKIMLSGALQGDCRSFNTRSKEFDTDFNNWLNGIDIRCVNNLVIAISKADNPVNVPSWISQKKYFIDYNDNGLLDLIRITND